MSERKAPVLKLESIDDMLSFGGNSGALTANEIEIAELIAYPQHKYRLYEGERLNDMVESIRENGVLMPIIVWRRGEQNIILSGHNRANAAKLAGLIKIPCITKCDLSEAEAAAIVHETNLIQRSFTDLSHSEKAYCLVQHYESMKSQGKRNDKISEIEKLIFSQQNPHDIEENSTLYQIGTKLDTTKKAGQEYGLSRMNTARYIRLGTHLAQSLFNLLDNNTIAFNAAYSVSFISTSMQDSLADLIENESCKLDIKKADLIKEAHERNHLTELELVKILNGALKEKSADKSFKLKPDIISKYFEPSQSKKDIERIIDDALSDYFKREHR